MTEKPKKEQLVWGGDFARQARMVAAAEEGDRDLKPGHNGSVQGHAGGTALSGIERPWDRDDTGKMPPELAMDRSQIIDTAYGGMDGSGAWT